MNSMKELRREIDAVDDRIAELLEQRLKIIMRIRDHKGSNGIPVSDPAREEEILFRLVSGRTDEQFIREVYRTIFACSREIQEN